MRICTSHPFRGDFLRHIGGRGKGSKAISLESPALVLLPGLDGTATLHAGFTQAAADFYESISIVIYPPDQPLNYQELESVARTALPSSAPFVLMGESFSGPIALSIAANPPPNLRGLILSTTFAVNAVPWLKPFASLMRTIPAPLPPMPLLSWFLLGRWGNLSLRAELRDALHMVRLDVLRARAAMTLEVDMTEQLPAISLPVLYLRATEDRLLSSTACELITSKVKRSKRVDIPGPHLLLQTAPAECAKAIGEFMETLR